MPFYEDQAAIDSARLAMLRHTIFDAPAADPPALNFDRVTYAQLHAAAQFDPAAVRAFWKVMGMICQPDEVYTDQQVVATTHEVLQHHGSGPAMALPSCAQLRSECNERRTRSRCGDHANVCATDPRGRPG